MSNVAEVKVWDPLVRIFHWALVAAFAIAYLAEDEVLGLHTFTGYTVLGLVAFRLVWGLVGTRHARFGDFVTSPRTAFAYARNVVQMRARRYIGHNPAGGLMIVLMLLGLAATTVTGIAVYGAEEQAGPLAAWMGGVGDSGAQVLEDSHEFFANATVLLVLVHVSGVLVEGLVHRENLIRSMFTGRKRA